MEHYTKVDFNTFSHMRVGEARNTMFDPLGAKIEWWYICIWDIGTRTGKNGIMFIFSLKVCSRLAEKMTDILNQVQHVQISTIPYIFHFVHDDNIVHQVQPFHYFFLKPLIIWTFKCSPKLGPNSSKLFHSISLKTAIPR